MEHTPITRCAEILRPGEHLAIPTPNAKNYKSIGFTARINRFDTLTLSHGKENPYCSAILVIDNVNVSVYEYQYRPVLLGRYPHSLTIADYLSVSVRTEAGFTARLQIASRSGIYCREIVWNGSNGEILAESGNSELTDARLTYHIKGVEKPVWLFGDSYLDFWPRNLVRWGVTDCYLDGFSGRGSLAAVESLRQVLVLGVPKKVVWFMGMNDADTDTVNPNWLAAYEALVSLSKEYGFEVILTTTPNVPARSNRQKNRIVRESGLRYLDLCSAVGADENPKWYPGLLGPDQVHPTYDRGAPVIAQYILSHLPEIC